MEIVNYVVCNGDASREQILLMSHDLAYKQLERHQELGLSGCAIIRKQHGAPMAAIRGNTSGMWCAVCPLNRAQRATSGV